MPNTGAFLYNQRPTRWQYPQTTNQVALEKRYEYSNWQVSLKPQLERAGNSIYLSREARYTFGVALHGADNPGGGMEHWLHWLLA